MMNNNAVFYDSERIVIEIASFGFLRLAGLSVDNAAALNREESKRTYEALRQSKQEKIRLAQACTDSLYQAISVINDNNVRQNLLNLRRAIYNDRKIKLSTASSARLTQDAPETLRLLEQYQGELERIESRFHHFCLAVQQDIDASRDLLWRVAAIPEFRQALALAAPSLMTGLIGSASHNIPRKKRRALERSLFSFFIRATMKTSPFSHFGCTAAVVVNRSQKIGENRTAQMELHQHTQLNRSIAVSLREALYQPVSLFERNLPLIRNPSVRLCLRHDDNGQELKSVHVPVRQYQSRQGMLWAEEHSINRTQLVPVLTLLGDMSARFTPSELLAKMEGLGYSNTDAKRLIRQLLRQDMVRPAIQWNAHEPSPANRLSRELEKLIPFLPEVLPWLEVIQELSSIEERAIHFSAITADQRPAVLHAIQQQWHHLHSLLDNRPKPDVRSLVFEDVKTTESVMTLPAGFVEKTAERIARVLASCAHFSMDYLWLHRRFIEIFGEGGECVNVAEFITTSWQAFIQFSIGYHPMTWSALHTMSHDIPVDKTALPLTVYFQIDAENSEQVMQGTPRVIINLAYNRLGWQSARQTSPDAASPLTQQISDWLSVAGRKRRLATLSVSGESSNLQAHARLSDAVLCVDEESQHADDLRLSDLRLYHNSETGLLELTDALGAPLQLQYLGGSTPMPAWGPKYLLIALSEPVQVGRPGTDMIIATDNPQSAEKHVRHQPRLEIENCVLIRETWWVRSSWFKQHYPSTTPEERVASLLDIFAAWNIPDEVFVHGQHSDFFSWEALAATSMRKPMWCRAGNSMSADYLFDLARDAEWLVLREALPSPSAAWCFRDGKPYVSEFMLEMNVTLKSGKESST